MLDVQKTTTEELRQILRDDAEKAGHVCDTAFLYEVMGELARRNQESGLKLKTDLEAWQEFLMYYAPKKFINGAATDKGGHPLSAP
jgi:hypothetical protein